MFSLFRCLFWLGLVFSHIAALEGTDPAGLVRQTALAATHQAASLGQNAVDAAGKKCASAPETCLALAAQAARLNPAASQDTLKSGDRIPAWRLRTTSQ
jgi:hypothetical protein